MDSDRKTPTLTTRQRIALYCDLPEERVRVLQRGSKYTQIEFVPVPGDELELGIQELTAIASLYSTFNVRLRYKRELLIREDRHEEPSELTIEVHHG